MENDISNMFKEKNREIFKNSLQLEMERNLDTLKQTIYNCTTLEINKVHTFLKEYFKEENVKWAEKELSEMIEKENTEIIEIINNQIEIKKKELVSYFCNENSNNLVIEEEYIEDYYNKIDDVSTKMLKNVEIEIKKEISTEFTPEILRKYSLKTKDQTMRIEGRIDTLFTDTLAKKVKEEILFRDDSLKNMCKESYNKYLNLNQMTT